MNAAFQALAVYDREPCARSFEADLAAHLTNGFVWSAPDCFWMARPVDSTAPVEQIVDPRCTFTHCDAWLIYLAAGRDPIPMLREQARKLPYQLPLVGWEKRNRLRWYAWNAFDKF